ncbi:MAG: hypothetical protein E7331_05340 [Clostridiales bacterium]|nr:hypothetical protein [Clostridiales bacterium]
MRRSMCICLTAILLAMFCPAAQASEMTATDALPNLRYLTPLENGYAGIGDGERLMLISYEGETVLSIPLDALLGDDINGGLSACCGDGEGGLYAVFSRDENTPDPLIHLFHFSNEGEILWSALFQQTTVWGWMHLSRDGLGGVILAHASWDNYKEIVIRRFSSDGEILWKKLLRAEGLILKPYVLRPGEGGGCMLYGTALSKSKGIYKAVELCIGPEGDLIHAVARDYSFRPDYSAFLKWEPLSDEILFVSRENYLDTRGTERINVPLTELEPCALPEIILSDAGLAVR